VNYPTPHLIEDANHLQLAKWHRFLPTPSDSVETAFINRIHFLLMQKGGYTTEINDAIGYEKAKLEE